jgi:hypothetical protein
LASDGYGFRAAHRHGQEVREWVTRSRELLALLNAVEEALCRFIGQILETLVRGLKQLNVISRTCVLESVPKLLDSLAAVLKERLDPLGVLASYAIAPVLACLARLVTDVVVVVAEKVVPAFRAIRLRVLLIVVALTAVAGAATENNVSSDVQAGPNSIHGDKMFNLGVGPERLAAKCTVVIKVRSDCIQMFI